MRALARRLRINVGLAMRDHEEMVYLESFRFNAGAAQRIVVSGHRVPIELTALGRAYLAVASEPERSALISELKARGRKRWPTIEHAIAEAAIHVERRGFCVASWQPEVVALATPIVVEPRPIHVLNVSVTSPASVAAVVRSLEAPLTWLAADIRQAIAGLDQQGG
jgi:DNA-binding IclR family transcriptional regulator